MNRKYYEIMTVADSGTVEEIFDRLNFRKIVDLGSLEIFTRAGVAVAQEKPKPNLRYDRVFGHNYEQHVMCANSCILIGEQNIQHLASIPILDHNQKRLGEAAEIASKGIFDLLADKNFESHLYKVIRDSPDNPVKFKAENVSFYRNQ